MTVSFDRLFGQLQLLLAMRKPKGVLALNGVEGGVSSQLAVDKGRFLDLVDFE